jgi:uncharacterized protein (TIGR02466 family)
MSTNNFALFPTLVQRVDNFLSATECVTVFEYIKNLNDGKKHNLIVGGDSRSNFGLASDFINNVSVCPDLGNRMQVAVQNYAAASGFNFSKMENSWYSVQDVGSKLDNHTHPLSTFSGVLYINVDEESSPLYFFNPNQHVYNTFCKSATEYSYLWFKFQPKNGELYIFPSWLCHGSNGVVNNTKNRTIISFNAY